MTLINRLLLLVRWVILIPILSPFPDPWTAATGDFRTERLYYDGIRRIQEVVVDPVQGNSNGEDADGEQGQIGGGTAAEHLEREYVWGPGDNGFDELLVQYDSTGAAWWAIMDAGGDLVALCDFGGSGSTARVVGQWTYDAYGAVLSADHLYPMAFPHLGHKGLFVDRLDVGIVTGVGGGESVRLAPFAHVRYHVRNRVYDPQAGRFNQRDPNATAISLLSMSSSGRGMAAIALAFSMEEMYGDGMNLYEYLGSNPWNRSDPLGLSWDPFDIVDDYLAESAGNRAALLGALGRDLNAAAIVAATVASYLPFPVVGNLGELALYALGAQSGGQTGTAMAMGMVPGGKLATAFGKFVGKIGGSALRSATRFAAGKAGARILGWVFKKGSKKTREEILEEAAESAAKKENTKLIRDWFGRTLETAKNAGKPPPGMTPEIAHAYIRFVRHQMTKKKGGGTEVAEMRIKKMVEWFGDPDF